MAACLACFKLFASARASRVRWASRMSMAQVNRLARRTPPTWGIDAIAATRYLQQIYQPLSGPVLAADGNLSEPFRQV